jgi:hypothetical protein
MESNDNIKNLNKEEKERGTNKSYACQVLSHLDDNGNFVNVGCVTQFVKHCNICSFIYFDPSLS